LIGPVFAGLNESGKKLNFALAFLIPTLLLRGILLLMKFVPAPKLSEIPRTAEAFEACPLDGVF
jgi:hypothetical protein